MDQATGITRVVAEEAAAPAPPAPPHQGNGLEAPPQPATAPQEQVQAPVGSPLASLREKAAQARSAAVNKVPVPRMDPIVLHLRPVKAEELTDIYERRKKAPVKEQMLLVSCDILVACCTGIYEQGPAGEDGQPTYSASGQYLQAPPGAPLTFATLGMAEDGTKAVDEVKALFVTDGDLISASEGHVLWSGFKSALLSQAALGE